MNRLHDIFKWPAHYKILQREIKECINKWWDVLCFCVGNFNIFKSDVTKSKNSNTKKEILHGKGKGIPNWMQSSKEYHGEVRQPS